MATAISATPTTTIRNPVTNATRQANGTDLKQRNAMPSSGRHRWFPQENFFRDGREWIAKSCHLEKRLKYS
jgi:hypothetical protein